MCNVSEVLKGSQMHRRSTAQKSNLLLLLLPVQNILLLCIMCAQPATPSQMHDRCLSQDRAPTLRRALCCAVIVPTLTMV